MYVYFQCTYDLHASIYGFHVISPHTTSLSPQLPTTLTWLFIDIFLELARVLTMCRGNISLNMMSSRGKKYNLGSKSFWEKSEKQISYIFFNSLMIPPMDKNIAHTEQFSDETNARKNSGQYFLFTSHRWIKRSRQNLKSTARRHRVSMGDQKYYRSGPTKCSRDRDGSGRSSTESPPEHTFWSQQADYEQLYRNAIEAMIKYVLFLWMVSSR